MDLTQSCACVLNFTDLDEEQENTTISTENDVDSSTSGYSSGSLRSTVTCQEALQVMQNRKNNAIYERNDLGVRPQCVGQEKSPMKKVHYHRVSKSPRQPMMARDSDTSSFMHVPMCRHSITSKKSKTTHKSLGHKLKQFRQQFHHHQNNKYIFY
jgi:hypothetical protein